MPEVTRCGARYQGRGAETVGWTCSRGKGHTGDHYDGENKRKWANTGEPPKQLQPGEQKPLIIETGKNETFSQKMARQRADMEKRKEEHLTSEDLKDRRAVAQERGQTGKRVIKKNTDLTAKVNPNPLNQTDKKVDHKKHVIFGTSLPWAGQRHNDQNN